MSNHLQGVVSAVLFDHDGTLVDSEVIHYQLWQDVLRPYGVQLSEDLYQTAYAGLPTAANAVDVVKRFGLQVEPAVLVAEKDRLVRAYLATAAFPLMPDALETLQALRAQGLRLGLVTGARRYVAEATLAYHALESYFEVVVTADDVRHNKPAPDVYQRAIQQLNLSATQCVALEDSATGFQSATQAGVPCIAVPTPLSLSHDFNGAVALVANLTAAHVLINNLRNKQ